MGHLEPAAPQASATLDFSFYFLLKPTEVEPKSTRPLQPQECWQITGDHVALIATSSAEPEPPGPLHSLLRRCFPFSSKGAGGVTHRSAGTGLGCPCSPRSLCTRLCPVSMRLRGQGLCGRGWPQLTGEPAVAGAADVPGLRRSSPSLC